MAKKFFSANINSKKYRVFLDDVKLICKRIKKLRPVVPRFNEDQTISTSQSMDSSNEYLNDLTAEEIEISK